MTTPAAPVASDYVSNLSLRWKIPLRVMLAVIGTALAVTIAMIAREREELRQSLSTHALSLGRLMANTLVAPVLHDDIWRAYEILQSAREANPTAPELQAEVMLVTDRDARVYVASRPRDFPIGSDLMQASGAYALLPEQFAAMGSGDPRVFEPKQSPLFFVISPLVADGVPLGFVVLGYSKNAFVPRFLNLVLNTALVTLVVLGVILPVSWYLARKTGEPLVALAEAMRQVPDQLDDAAISNLPASRDEIGQLGEAFRRMVGELKKKQQMEDQMVASERLAAVGRMTAGVAHEINNPLAGMLTAIKTFQRHGAQDPLTLQTMELLERGLNQIRQTVSALLVETRTRDREFGPNDIADLLILAEPAAQSRNVRIDNHAMLEQTLPLPAAMLRQILLNLLLNAIAAADEGGRVRFGLNAELGMLRISVCNDGEHIPESQMSYLFEPFVTGRDKGNGLGLWVVYQIVRELGGGLTVDSEPGCTTFRIEIPYDET